MSGWPFRFVHASDFHLELPLFGVSEVPAHLREVFLEAPYDSARRVFDSVLAEEAEFLLLAGDLLNPINAGPRGVLFLLEQFQRLAARNIPVYWATGRVDSTDGWPVAAALPANVHLFPRGRATERIYERDAQRLARLLGVSRQQRGKIRGADFFVESDELFSIAVVHGDAEIGSLERQGIDYWAFGGEHQRQSLAADSTTIQYCGSPQGREPSEVGPHGCLLVHVDDRRTVRTTLVETDAARWCQTRVELDETNHAVDLEERMRNRLGELRSSAPATTLLVSWTVAASGSLLTSLRHGGLAAQLLDRLRADFGREHPVAWSVDLTVERAAPLPQPWYEEDTILGEYLRRLRQLEADGALPIEIEKLLGEEHLAGSTGSLLALSTSESRLRTLRGAALLGAELLRGDEPAPQSH